ncbi:transglutaminase family protein [Rubinisphaera margarita]|uniref:transglutaminase family protein n=1 Tax=Rubinisphaera margarita TaxID=2909586 RepID=UPI001EE92933|nr:DUF3488 and transglutaminase-like domain-containing protein [Rubinisphaera margarita]MCG6155196.1 DUF3488 and transglutaminase-like domain-containing protein [Rubinisphaera margarita]
MIHRISHVFRLSIYTLLGLSSLTIGLAEGNLFPHLLTIPLIIVVYLLLQDRPLLKLESVATSVVGICALLMALWEFQLGRVNIEMRILSASHLLAYFTWIVLLLEKRHQQYWWLLALSMLNMAVSASLTTSGMFGLAVLLYLFLAIWTLALFTAFRGTTYLRDAEAKAQKAKASEPAAPAGVSPGPAPKAPLIPAVSQVRGGFHFDPSDNWLGYRLVAGVFYLVVASTVVGLGVFLITPRIWIGNWQLPSADEQALPMSFGSTVSGFTSEVQLGDIGEILSNPTPVLYVRFSDVNSGEELSNEQVMDRMKLDDLLFRGATLHSYENGRWRPTRTMVHDFVKTDYRRGREGLIKFNYELEPIGRETLFAVPPVDFGRILNDGVVEKRIERNFLTQEISAAPSADLGRLSTIKYEVVTFERETSYPSGYPEYEVIPDPYYIDVLRQISSSIESEYQEDGNVADQVVDLSQFNVDRRTRAAVAGFDRYYRSLLVYDEEQLSQLKVLARDLCETDGEDPLGPLQRAVRLNDYLKFSGEYGYTLDMTVTDPNRDPVEDFLLLRKQGHCEYFASALTLMLRAVGVPSRMATGFRTGRYDESDDRLVVEQRHAHAWTEAFIDGRWVVLDPTTGGSEVIDYSNQMAKYSFSWMRAQLMSFWQSRVLGVTLSEQQDKIYNPLRDTAKAAFNAMTSVRDQVTDSVVPGAQTRYSIYNRIIMTMATLFPVIVIAGVVAVLLFRQRLRNFLDWLFPQRRAMRSRHMIKFFRSFVDLAGRHGLHKEPQQTGMEFAHAFQRQFSSELRQASLMSLPVALTDAYYQARFKGTELTDEQTTYWESQIDQLQSSLKASPS